MDDTFARVDGTTVGPRPHVGPTTLATCSDSWWERERLIYLLEAVPTDPIRLHLDVGGGRGTFARALRRRGQATVCVDAHSYDEWRPGDGVCYVIADADRLPFRDVTFGSVTALDVIEHIGDDCAVTRELSRVALSGANVTLTVPASQRLWSVHDERVGHFRRYDMSEILRAVGPTRLAVGSSTHFFAWLYPVALATRGARANLTGSEGGSLTTWVARCVSAVERWVLRRWRLPFGTSLFVVCEKMRT